MEEAIQSLEKLSESIGEANVILNGRFTFLLKRHKKECRELGAVISEFKDALSDLI